MKPGKSSGNRRLRSLDLFCNQRAFVDCLAEHFRTQKLAERLSAL